MSKIVFGTSNSLLSGDSQGITLTRIALGDSQDIEIRAITHRELRAPLDGFSSLETIDCVSEAQPDDIAILALNSMASNYGKLLYIRDYVRNSLYRGFIDNHGRGYSSNDGLCVDIFFTILVKDKYSL